MSDRPCLGNEMFLQGSTRVLKRITTDQMEMFRLLSLLAAQLCVWRTVYRLVYSDRTQRFSVRTRAENVVKTRICIETYYPDVSFAGFPLQEYERRRHKDWNGPCDKAICTQILKTRIDEETILLKFT